MAVAMLCVSTDHQDTKECHIMVDNRTRRIARRVAGSVLLAGVIGITGLGVAATATAGPPRPPAAGYNDCFSYGGISECWPS